MNKLSHIAIISCTVFFFAASAYGQSIGSFSTHQKVGVPMSVQESDMTCINWHSWCGYHPQSYSEYKLQYDTLRHYIESCAKDDNSYQAFAAMDG
ncbi:MAG: hypothetical protein WCH46_07525, partial [bacterium]